MKFEGVLNLSVRDKILKYHHEIMEKIISLGFHVPSDLNQKLTIDLSNHLAVTAGKAFLGKGLIKLNYRILYKNDKELLATYGHELMHIVAYHIYKKNVGHGYEWKNLMTAIGLAPERCHQLNVSQGYQSRTLNSQENSTWGKIYLQKL
jgi:hypothetical protein